MRVSLCHFRPLAAASLLLGAWSIIIALAACYGQAPKEAKEKNERRRAQLLEEMRGLAQQTKVQLAKGESRIELVKEPVFRYDDQPRRFIGAE